MDARIQGVWLTGSHARGTNDQFSDVDLWIVMAAEDIESFCDNWSTTADKNMVEDAAVEDRGGALHLAPLLRTEHLQSLSDLPAIGATRESVIESHFACAEVFLPLARDMHERCGLDWPASLEGAVRHISSTLSIEVPDSTR